ncbi:MAG: 23S rRNA (adenine(2503)-C(2))-methyltransferase RlmN [Eubacteriales bacterium]|nr:23S rRNA (adenine(2503)-C(2))-methyltransferase RlmN [Eubacteriales bacterium]
MTEKIALNGFTYEELEQYVLEMGESKFRAKQIFQWIAKGASIGEMTNLSAALRARLEAVSTANPVAIQGVYSSQIDDTEKFLYALEDDNLIEGVVMRYHHGDTLCVSTQVGCRMGCSFCASTLEGRVRNLTPGEMLGQVLCANRHIQQSDKERRIHNIVLMGSGEPLDNYENVMKFLRLVNDERGLNISLRNVSLSTCGLIPQMYALADEGVPVTLSVSLHASNDRIRRELMPVANANPMEKLLAACRNYLEKTGRRVIFEYALIRGVNDSFACADELAKKLRGMQCHVNLIPLNEVKERNLAGVSRKEAEAFMTRLIQRGTSATIRREMGADIDGACGQLRRHVIQGKNSR